jgi:hypothetical protein
MKLGFNKEKVTPLIFAIIFTTLVFADNNYLNHQLLSSLSIVAIVAIGFVLIVIMIVSGYAIYKAVLHASVGFGVLIFMAQTYCDLQTQTPEGLQALTFLWGMGLIFISYDFITKFQEAFKEHKKRFENAGKSWEYKLTMVAYILFVVFYLACIYQVLTPIISGLCIY